MDFDLAHDALLPAVPPFSLAAALHAMAGFRPSTADRVVLGDHVRTAFAAPGAADRAVVVDVGPRPDAAPGIHVRVYAESPLTADAAAAVERDVSRWLGLDDDLRPFLALAAADPPVASLVDEVAGLHQVRFRSLSEGVTYFALTQRSTQWFATARKQRIASELGARGDLDGGSYVAFPPFSRLTGLGAEGLLPYAGNAQRAGRLAEVIDGVAALDEEWLRTAPYEEAKRALLAVRGVGDFTAHAILLRVLGRPDDTPLEMTQFTTAAQAVYGEPAPSPAELRARYGAYVGWWAYLCRTALGARNRPTRAEASAGAVASVEE
jgi:DNA-3-methyladenine glycosylase II